MLFGKRKIIGLIRRWQTEQATLEERIENLVWDLNVKPQGRIRHRNFLQLCALHEVIELHFVTELEMLTEMQKFQHGRHIELDACARQARREQLTILAYLKQTINEWEAERPMAEEANGNLFDIFAEYWDLHRERIETSINLLFPTYNGVPNARLQAARV
ncbi:MAG: hypothetical protein ACE361_08640 [Aureliella sp.]